jgi:ribonuclease Z
VGDGHDGRNIAARYVKLPPMFEITFLGTSASVPTTDRGLSSLLVEHGRHRFLIDCGEGTQRQLMASGLGFRRLDKVLLTHGHLDHLLGLGGLAGTLNLWRSTDRLEIHAGPAPLRLARRLLEEVVWPDGPPRMRLDWIELSAGPVFTVPDLSVSAFPVRHAGDDCFGFLFEETPRQPLNGALLDELGVPAGEERGLLARGKAVTLADGRRVEAGQVLGPERRGMRIAVVGDCESTDGLAEHVRGVDLLVIEATFLNADADKAEARSHLTVGQATRLARDAGVGQLWLNHQSNRYGKGLVEAEARAGFGNVRVAADFDRVTVG